MAAFGFEVHISQIMDEAVTDKPVIDIGAGGVPADQPPYSGDLEQLARNHALEIHPVCNFLPLLANKALDDLAEDIRTHGLVDPIIVHGGQIVDGRNRLLACQIAGVEPRFREWHDVYGGSMPLARWIYAQNVQRRHLSPDQRAAVTVLIREFEERKLAAERKAEGWRRGGQVAGRGRAKPESLPMNSSETNAFSAAETSDQHDQSGSGDVRARIAVQADCSEYKAQQAMSIHQSAPDLLQEVARSQITLREAVKRVEAPKPPMSILPAKESAAPEIAHLRQLYNGPNSHPVQTVTVPPSAAEDGSLVNAPASAISELATRFLEAVRIILELLPKIAAIAAHIREKNLLKATELGAVVEVLIRIHAALSSHSQIVGSPESSVAGYALPPGPNGARSDSEDSDDPESLENFQL